MNVPMNLAIYDDGLIDAAIGRATDPSTGLTALQVSGAMRCFSRMIFSEDRYPPFGIMRNGIDDRCSRT
jgi:hypothetical protein